MNKILVVEDELAIAELINIALTQEGYQVEYALDGKRVQMIILLNHLKSKNWLHG